MLWRRGSGDRTLTSFGMWLTRPKPFSLEWGGESEQSAKGQASIKALFPVCLLGMFVLVVCLFNGLREAAIIFLCIPFSFTTILGMAPLLFHPFFASMAATIMGGLLVATGLTLVVVPVFYSLFFRISRDEMIF